MRTSARSGNSIRALPAFPPSTCTAAVHSASVAQSSARSPDPPARPPVFRCAPLDPLFPVVQEFRSPQRPKLTGPRRSRSSSLFSYHQIPRRTTQKAPRGAK